MNKLMGHIKTISTHWREVMKEMVWIGRPIQGILHDWSKLFSKEILIYKYYDNGKKSPHARAREEIGWSPYWKDHYHRNKHHWEYWLDESDEKGFYGIKIPYKYIIEMFCDRVAACKVYCKGSGKEYTRRAPLDYYEKNKGNMIMEKKSQETLEALLKYYIRADIENILSEEELFKKVIKRALPIIKENYYD